MISLVNNYLANIKGVAIYPLISLSIFFVFFIVLFLWVWRAKKTYIEKVRNIPFD